MADQPTALRLAAQLEDAESARLHLLPYAAAELRRLVAENEALKLTVALQKASYERGIKIGMEAEREACADICDQHASIEGIAQRCAEQLRARSKT
jgi:hypothetical protein